MCSVDDDNTYLLANKADLQWVLIEVYLYLFIIAHSHGLVRTLHSNMIM